MNQELPYNGVYSAIKTPGQSIKLGETPNSHAYAAWIPVTLTSGEIAWSGFGMFTIVSGEGVAQEGFIDRLHQIFPEWTSPYPVGDDENGTGGLIAAAEITDRPFQVTGERGTRKNKQGEEVPVFNLKWIDVLGASGGFTPAVVSRTDFMEKFGAKFGQESSAPTAKAAKAPAAAAPASRPAAVAAPGRRPASVGSASTAAARTATEEVWIGLTKKHPDMDSNGIELQNKFFDAQDKIKPGANGVLTPSEWGKVAIELGL